MAHASSQNPLRQASRPSLDTPRSPLSPPPAAPASFPCKLPSSKPPPPPAPSPARFFLSQQFPAFFPTHPCRIIDPGPNFSILPIAQTVPLLPIFAPPPSSASTQNPPSFHQARPAYSSPQFPASCTRSHPRCRIPPRRSPQFAVSAPPAKLLHQFFPLTSTPGHLSPRSAPPILHASAASPPSCTPRRTPRSKFRAPSQTIRVSPIFLVAPFRLSAQTIYPNTITLLV